MHTLQIILTACFWLSAAGVVYAYIGYPALIWALSRLFGRTPAPPAINEADLPRLTLLIAAYNEESVIEARIQNALALNYPRQKLEIVIASDGSDDGTAEICRRYEGRIRPMLFPHRRGKAATLNAAMEALDTDVVVLSDANTSMERDALLLLARWFAEPDVGAVCGRLVLDEAGAGGNGDGVYWRYETFLKTCEARLGGLLGANGAIYAVRRGLFSPLPPGTLVDDFIIPLAARMRSGCRIVYEREAIACEETAPGLSAEFRRRSRIGTGGSRALRVLWPLLGPRYGWTAFTLWSHKILRWACPFLLIGAFVSAMALSGAPLYRLALIAQLAFYTLCIVGIVLPAGRTLPHPLRLCPMFAGMNLALFMGVLRGLRNDQSGVWARTDRL
jgi:cellulose synthase/poly-beta-1,6-N-acetylglucosamine synthase-like glycosyltransferase